MGRGAVAGATGTTKERDVPRTGVHVKVEWPKDGRKQDPFAGDDMRSVFVRELRAEFETAFERWCVKQGHRLRVWSLSDVFNHAYAHVPGAPKRSTLYKVFKLEATGDAVAQVLTRVEVPTPRVESLAERNDVIRTGGPAAASEHQTRQQRRFASVGQRVRDGRLAWDAAEAGTAAYRNPELALPRELLSTAFEAATAGELSREDVAYCLYSAIKHCERYRDWVALCPASIDAAEATLDLVMVPAAGTMVRALHRAAWTLQFFDDPLRDAAARVAAALGPRRTDGTVELVEAARVLDVEATVQQRLDAGYYTPSDAAKVRSVLEGEWRRTVPVSGARGRIATLLADESGSHAGGYIQT